ncbi:MAG TPA: hypothetical protein VFM93_09495 [Candidatus Limnocylindria bacterium]|nr:hypothetical protein [Candidatus Limnocylindria bacterium]
MTETQVTDLIDEAIEEQRERATNLQKQLDCECPATDCTVDHGKQ